jgi:hypothetical protein
MIITSEDEVIAIWVGGRLKSAASRLSCVHRRGV